MRTSQRRFSASSLRIIASVDTRRTGDGGFRTLLAHSPSWCTLDVVCAHSRWFAGNVVVDEGRKDISELAQIRRYRRKPVKAWDMISDNP